MATSWVVCIGIAYFLLLSSVAAAKSPTVIIVGAGMSGISAAKTLSDAGIKDFLILETTNRVGGRIWKTNFGGVPVEIGANWVEGVGGSQMNPIWTMANKLHLKTFYSDFDNITSNTYKQVGGLEKSETVQKVSETTDEVIEYAEKLSSNLSAHGDGDVSVLTAQRLRNQVPSTPLEMAIDYYNFDYEFAEPPRVTSLQNTVPLPTVSNFGEDSYFVADPRGYESVVHYVGKQFLTYKSGVISDPRVLLKKGCFSSVESPLIYRRNFKKRSGKDVFHMLKVLLHMC